LVDEDKIISLIKDRNPSGIELALKTYSRLVYTVVSNILHIATVQDIEECTSDVFMELWTSTENYDPTICSLKTWVVMLSRRKAIDMLRKLSKKNNDLSLDDDIPIGDMSPEEYCVYAESKQELFDAINKLDNDDRILFYHRYYLCHIDIPRKLILSCCFSIKFNCNKYTAYCDTHCDTKRNQYINPKVWNLH
jgi:RNA polymerase sigma-70 factor (ECF subfamily)